MSNRHKGLSTRLIHANPLDIGNPLGREACFTSSYRLELTKDGVVEPRDADYGRVGNPTFTKLERQVSQAAHADYTTVFGSGIAAISAVVLNLEQGSLIMAEENTYGCTMRLLRDVMANKGIEVVYLDFTKVRNHRHISHVKPNLIMLESPTNPNLKILDLKALSARARRAGSTLVVDNSFASCALQQPLNLGADIVVESLTKYANGHSSGMCGAASTNDPVWAGKLDFMRKAVGLQPGVSEALDTSRFMEDLELRMSRHSANALKVARFLEKSPLVSSVRYPFLRSHPQYELARKQMKSGSGVITVEFNLDRDNTVRLLNSLNPVFTIAHSIGSTKSQVSMPALMSHASVPREQRIEAGITDGLVRFSIGLENPADLIGALQSGLAAFVQ